MAFWRVFLGEAEIFFLLEALNQLKIESKLAGHCCANFGSIFNSLNLAIKKILRPLRWLLWLLRHWETRFERTFKIM